MEAIETTVHSSEEAGRATQPTTLDIEAFRKIRTAKPFPQWLAAELRSDHAGEVGAVEIYRGALTANRDVSLSGDILRHLETERRHLRAFEMVLGPEETSRVLFLWRVAGWLLGYVATRAGKSTYYRTIAAVEAFVDVHYEQQIRRLTVESGNEALLALLRACQRDEIQHRDEAASRVTGTPGWLGQMWGKIVGAGSSAAVALARRI